MATSLDHLGLVLKLEGKWDEAEQSLRHALQIREKVLGDGHPATIISRDHVRELEKERKAHKPEG